MTDLSADQLAILEAIAMRERKRVPCQTKHLPTGAKNGDTYQRALGLSDRGYLVVKDQRAAKSVGRQYNLTLAGWALVGGAPLWVAA